MTTVQRWGNSLGVRIPRDVADALRLRAGSSVIVAQEDGAVVVRRAKREETLASLVSRISPANRHGSLEWGASRGTEAW